MQETGAAEWDSGESKRLDILRAWEKVKIELERENKEFGGLPIAAAQDASTTPNTFQDEDAKNKEEYVTLLQDVKATQGSHSGQQKTSMDGGSDSIGEDK